MKKLFNFIFSNDKTTAKDELLLTAITALIILIAVLIIVFRAAIPLFIQKAALTAAGLMILLGVMLFSIVIYRLSQNYRDNRKGK